nr:hypothetical protein GCM10020092_042560 [Actinoplanes digitatis]
MTLVPQGLEVAAFAGLAAGHHDAALAAATEGAALARATGQPGLAQNHLGVLAVLAALVGDRDTCMLRIRAAGVYDSANGPGQARAFCEWALALLDLVEGRPRAALHRLDSIFVGPAGRGSLVVQVAATPHLIEAYWRCDPPPHTPPVARTAVLDGAFEPFDRWAAGTGQPYWLALRARCRALRAADPHAAEEYFQEALREHRRGDADFARAHTELLFGRDLRRRLPAGRRPRAPAPGRGDVPAAGRGAVGGAGRRRAARRRRARSAAARVRGPRADRSAGADRPAGGRRRHQPGGGRAALPQPPGRSTTTCATSSPGSACARAPSWPAAWAEPYTCAKAVARASAPMSA